MDEHFSDGLFKTWFNKINRSLKAGGKINDVLTDFSGLKSDKDRARYMLDLAEFKQHIQIRPPNSGKSQDDAVKYRNEGNAFFKKKEDTRALEKYTESILFSPFSESGVSSNEILALGFANRSAVLFNQEKYKLCVRDIDSAFQNGYPGRLSYKLHFRKAKCFLQQGLAREGKLSVENAKRALLISDLDESKRKKWLADIGKTERNLDNATVKTVPYSSSSPKIPEVSYGKHDTFIAASDAFGIGFSPKKGRYVVAQRDLKPGDVILVERPYASVLLPEKSTTHCHHCFTYLEAAVPCHACSTVRFCSSECKQKAWSEYHRIECPCLSLLFSVNVGKFGLLAIRCLTVSSMKSILEFEHQLDGLDAISDDALFKNTDGQYHPMEYGAVYNLVTHTGDRKVHDLFPRAVLAAFLTQCLSYTSYFTTDPQGRGRDSELAVIGGHILRHLQILPCNAHEISYLELDTSSVATSVSLETAAGIYATLSLFNHSCDPSATRNFYGDSCVVRVIKTVSKGEEISDNYGAVYAVQSKHERQSKLSSQYYFNCTCLPCVSDWPLYPNIPYELSQIKWLCQSCKGDIQFSTESCKTCVECGVKIDLNAIQNKYIKSERDYNEAFEALLACDIVTATPILERHLAFICSNIRLPWRDCNNCQEALKQCYCILGNVFSKN